MDLNKLLCKYGPIKFIISIALSWFCCYMLKLGYIYISIPFLIFLDLFYEYGSSERYYNKEKNDNAILLLFEVEDKKEFRDFMILLKEEIKKSIKRNEIENQIQLKYVDDYYYNNRMLKMNIKTIRKFYKYNYVAKVKLVHTTESNENVIILYPEIMIAEDSEIMKGIENDYIKICEQCKIIPERNKYESIVIYSNNMVIGISFMLAVIFCRLSSKDSSMIESAEILVESILIQLESLPKYHKISAIYSNLKDICTHISGDLKIFKFDTLRNEDERYSEEEIEKLKQCLNKYKGKAGDNVYYYNCMAIICFLHGETRSKIDDMIINAGKKAKTQLDKIVVLMNRAFICMYFKDYSQGIKKYIRAIEMIEKTEKTKEIQKELLRIINEIYEFVFAIYKIKKNLGCKLVFIIMEAFKQNNSLVSEELYLLGNNSEYINISENIKREYEIMVKKLSDIEPDETFQYALT
jgi:hypothetical protein